MFPWLDSNYFCTNTTDKIIIDAVDKMIIDAISSPIKIRDISPDTTFKPFYPPIPKINDVIFNNPATIVKWSDGTKTVVKCQKGDTYSKEYGLAMAITKKVYGNKGNYNKIFEKWCKEDEIKRVN